jgi:hypothetical protein
LPLSSPSVQRSLDAPYVVSPYVVAKLDYLLGFDAGARRMAAFAELSNGARDRPTFDASELRQACAVVEPHPDQEICVADAALES